MSDIKSDVGSPKQFRFGITVKLTLWTLLGASLVLAFTLQYSEYFSSRIILGLVEKSATSVVQSASLQFDDRLQSVVRSTENLAYAVEFGNWNEVSLLDLLEIPRIDMVQLGKPHLIHGFEPFGDFRQTLRAPFGIPGIIQTVTG